MLKRMKKMCDLRHILVLNFLCLLINLFFAVMQLNHGFWPPETFYQPVLTPKDRELMRKTLEVFVGALEAGNITYMMYGGTLIGSYRHHGLIPWDDDTDFILNSTQIDDFKKAIEPLGPEFQLYESDALRTTGWKFYSKAAGKFTHRSFKWPYIDIFFFEENQTHIWDENPQYKSEFCFQKTDVFPLQKRPFEGMTLNAPCKTYEVLSTNYDIHMCASRSFSHINELPLFTFSQKSVPCKILEDKFPFVKRTCSNGIVTENLNVAEWTLQTFQLPESCQSSYP
ncbi:unnamed protein product [Owenia fusiformis]|uniref:LicD/FKTN/FKRP nucleotidyltransferase domain-containing protein n=1 Tax=Owenia fusiformis TaxID=6347 RepID=A0A8S4PTX4_OWEFU|nr:unnamed protein product [Owenia fusiformis]